MPDASAATAALEGADIPGDVRRCLEEVSLPAYALDRFGIIRWLNPAALDLVGDVRGRQQTSVVAPEQAREARESFTRKVLGTERATDASVVLLDPDGQRVLSSGINWPRSPRSRPRSARSRSGMGVESSACSASSRTSSRRLRRTRTRT